MGKKPETSIPGQRREQKQTKCKNLPCKHCYHCKCKHKHGLQCQEHYPEMFSREFQEIQRSLQSPKTERIETKKNICFLIASHGFFFSFYVFIYLYRKMSKCIPLEIKDKHQLQHKCLVEEK